MPINYTSYTQLTSEPSSQICTVYCKIWPTTSKETINTSFQSKKQSIEPYLVVDGVMINHNKGSGTTFLYLSLESMKVVKTFISRSIKFIHSNLFTSHNFSVGHINFVTSASFLDLWGPMSVPPSANQALVHTPKTESPQHKCLPS